MSSRKRKEWKAKCDNCNKVTEIKPRREGEYLTPCRRCGCETATYVLA